MNEMDRPADGLRDPELDGFLRQVGALRRGARSGRRKPHKLVLLLAVVDMAEDGMLQENVIRYGDELTARFKRRFAEFGGQGDWCKVDPPFFHLRSSGFWMHRVKLGRERAYEALQTAPGGSKPITDNIEYAYLTDPVYALLCDRASRDIVRACITGLLCCRGESPAAALLRGLRPLTARTVDEDT